MDKLGRLVIMGLLLCAAAIVGAHDNHPIPDNMCWTHGVTCETESDWVAGWYAHLRHSGASVRIERRVDAYRNPKTDEPKPKPPPPPIETDAKRKGSCYYFGGQCVSAYEFHCGTWVMMQQRRGKDAHMNDCSYQGK